MMMMMMMIEMVVVVVVVVMMEVKMVMEEVEEVTRERLRVGQKKRKEIVRGDGVPSQMSSRPLAGRMDHQPPWKDPSATLQHLCRHAVEDP